MTAADHANTVEIPVSGGGVTLIEARLAAEDTYFGDQA